MTKAQTTTQPSNHSISGPAFASAASTLHSSYSIYHNHPPFFLPNYTSPITNTKPSFTPNSLAFIELRLVLAKLHFTFEAELVNNDVDLERDSKMFILWNKPPINVRFTERTL